MPIYELLCRDCHHPYEVITSREKIHTRRCPDCGGRGERVVSAPGFRRDHTMVD